MWITLEQIQCLKAVEESGSINSAAESLNKAKSAVSYSINRLEEQLGFKVLDRSQYRITLTDQGEAFLHKSKRLLNELAELKEEAYKIASGVEMKLSLSASAIYPTGKLNNILKELILKYPSTEFTFHREILSGERMLLDGKVDLAIFESVKNSIDLESKKIADVKLQLVVCASHPFLKQPKKQQSIEALSKYPHIIQRSTIADPFVMGSPAEASRWTVSDIDSKKDLIVNNYGWGRLPSHYIEKDLKNKKLVHLKHLSYDHELEIFICRRKNQNIGPVMQFIWDSL